MLGGFGAFPAVIQTELDRYLPFLTTTKILMAAVQRGVGREVAHEAIKEHAVAVALEMREGLPTNDLLERLAADDRLGLSLEELRNLVSEPLSLTGAAGNQVEQLADRITQIVEQNPEAAAYRPGSVL